MDAQRLMDAIATIDELLKEVGAVRDKIDEKMDELNEVRDDCEGAFECLQDARDRLSELT